MSKAVWREASDLEVSAMVALSLCRFAPATAPKRFARHMAAQAPNRRITDKQADLLWKYLWSYRRSVRSKLVMAEARRRHEEPNLAPRGQEEPNG